MKYLLFIVLPFFLSINMGYTQSYQKDLESLFISKSNQIHTPKNKTRFVFFSKNKIIRYSPIHLTFSGLLYTYQAVISPQIFGGCPYELNCSNFSKQSIIQYGLIKGIALTADRLTRCSKMASVDLHPLSISPAGKIIDQLDQYKLR